MLWRFPASTVGVNLTDRANVPGWLDCRVIKTCLRKTKELLEIQKTTVLEYNNIVITPCSWFCNNWAAATLCMLGKYQIGWLRMSRSSSGISDESTTSSPQVGCCCCCVKVVAKSGQEVACCWLSAEPARSDPTSSWLPRSVGLVLKSLRMESRSDAKLFNICNRVKAKRKTRHDFLYAIRKTFTKGFNEVKAVWVILSRDYIRRKSR